MESNHHGAAESGQKFEKTARAKFEELGHRVLYYKRDFDLYDVDYYKFFHIKEHKLQELGYDAGFQTDGFVPSLNAIVEFKHTKQDLGTAQEKIMFDEKKIEYGVYNPDGDTKLLYILSGGMEKHICGKLFRSFVNIGKKAGKANYQNVHVLDYSKLSAEVFNELV